MRFTAPKDWDSAANGSCIDLMVQRMPDGEHVSFWKPTAAERRQIAEGGAIRLGVFGGQPPVMLSMAPVKELPPRSAAREGK